MASKTVFRLEPNNHNAVELAWYDDCGYIRAELHEKSVGMLLTRDDVRQLHRWLGVLVDQVNGDV